MFVAWYTFTYNSMCEEQIQMALAHNVPTVQVHM